MSVKEPGNTVQHSTGAVRGSAAGRGRYDLISPFMIDRLAKHLEAGAANYGDRNWEKGLPIARMFASLFRHCWQAFMQQEDEDHLAAIICNAMFILHTLEMIDRGRLPAALNDLPDYGSDGRIDPEDVFHPIPDGEVEGVRAVWEGRPIDAYPCKSCHHAEYRHRPGSNPPCVKPDGDPCHCMKFIPPEPKNCPRCGCNRLLGECGCKGL